MRVKEKAIIKHNDAKKAWKLNLLRNMYAHPGNWVAFIKQQYRMGTLSLETEMPQVYATAQEQLISMKLPSKKDAILKILELAQRKVFNHLKPLENLPDLDWCASQDTLGFY